MRHQTNLTSAITLAADGSSTFSPAADADGWTPAVPRPVPPLLEGVFGTSEATVAAVAELEAVMLKRFEAGALHTRAELDEHPDEDAILAVFDTVIDLELKTALALLDDSIRDADDRRARLTAFMRSRTLVHTHPNNWRVFTLDEAIEGADEEELAPALRYMLGSAPTDDERRAKDLADARWRDARAAHHAAKAAVDADTDEDAAASEALFDAYADALDAWENLTPPSMPGLAEVMEASIAFNLLDWTWQATDCPRTMRDMLDGGDAATQFAFRYYMHALRMAGSASPALTTPPIAGLFPAFTGSEHIHPDIEPGELEAAWNEHHGTVKPFPERDPDFAEWQPPMERFTDVSDQGGIMGLWQYSAALHRHAQALITEYEALGGKFTLLAQPDGRELFGTAFTFGSPRGDEIAGTVANHEPLRRAIAEIIRQHGVEAASPLAIAAE